MSLLPNPFYFLINITALTQFGLIPHSECSQKRVRKLVTVLEFDFCLSCCVISSKICTFFSFFPPFFLFFSVFHLVKAKWAVSCISDCIQCELDACTGV